MPAIRRIFIARNQISGDTYLAFDGFEQPEDGLGVGAVLAAPLGSNSPQNRDHGPDGDPFGPAHLIAAEPRRCISTVRRPRRAAP